MLRAYQQRMVDHIKATPKCALFAGMGLGKTLTILEAIKDLPKPVLIVGPKRVVSTVWMPEAEKWGYNYSMTLVAGTPAQRRKAAQTSSDIHLLGIDNLAWLWDLYADTWQWGTVIFDESSLLKSPSAKRTKIAIKVGAVASNVVLLTGTPAPNGMLNLWSQIKILDNGERLGRSMTAYKQRYFYTTDYLGYNWEVLPGKDEVIREKISDLCVSLSSDDYLSLPDLIINDVVVPLGAGYKQYEQMRKEMALKVGDDLIESESAAVLTGRLAQLSAGAIYTISDKAYAITHSAKLEALSDIVDASEGEPIVVIYNYRHSLERIRMQYPDAMEADTQGIAQWNKGKLQMLILHASSGYGLNLQSSGHTMVWFDLSWSLESYQQTNARLHRSGQEHPVTVHRLIGEHTIDNEIIERLAGKGTIQSILLRHLKR